MNEPKFKLYFNCGVCCLIIGLIGFLSGLWVGSVRGSREFDRHALQSQNSIDALSKGFRQLNDRIEFNERTIKALRADLERERELHNNLRRELDRAIDYSGDARSGIDSAIEYIDGAIEELQKIPD